MDNKTTTNNSTNSMKYRPGERRCVFCGKAPGEQMIVGNKTYGLCQSCWQLCGQLFAHAASTEKSAKKNYRPSEIMKVLDEHVIGQRSAKKHLAVAISNHCKCINDPTGNIWKRNIMMVGPTGSGKTLLAKTLANYLDVPMVIVNAPDYTQNGYIGGNVDSILVQLLAAAKYNTNVAQKGIIFFDEIDKIARKSATLSSSRDPAGEGVQQALLKMIEGAPVHLSVQNNGSVESFDFDTSKVLCICAGAFEGIKDEKRKKKQSAIGFHTDDMTSVKETTAITQDDLINFGILPELLGRTPVLVELDELTEDDLVRVLTEPKNSIVKSYQALFRAGGSELAFAPKTLQQIARSAIRKKTGARGLESILEKRLLDLMYEAPDHPEYNYYYICPDRIVKRHVDGRQTVGT